MKPIVFLVLLVFSGGALAQTPATQPSAAELQKCLLGTHEDTWMKLHLSEDQLQRMGWVQQACREECEAAGVKKVDNPISNADGSTVLSEVKNILTPDQYRAWVAQCAGSPSGAPPPK
jgi:hypothetical protein